LQMANIEEPWLCKLPAIPPACCWLVVLPCRRVFTELQQKPGYGSLSKKTGLEAAAVCLTRSLPGAGESLSNKVYTAVGLIEWLTGYLT
jgi:hypothetical protein